MVERREFALMLIAMKIGVYDFVTRMGEFLALLACPSVTEMGPLKRKLLPSVGVDYLPSYLIKGLYSSL